MTNEEIVMQIQNGGNRTAYMEQLYNQNIGLIIRTAKRYEGLESMPDLMQEAYFGLCSAVDLWDSTREGHFANYAQYWIKQAMLRYICNCGSIIRIPVHQTARIYQYHKTVNSFRVRFGRDPEPAEIMAQLEISAEQFERLKKDIKSANLISTSTPTSDDGETVLEDLIPDESKPIDDLIENLHREELCIELWGQVDKLPEREAAVIRQRYRDGLTLQQCGEAMGVTAEGAKHIQDSALRKLRRPKVARRLAAYLTNSAAYSIGLRSGYNSFKTNGASAQERAVMVLEQRTGTIWKNAIIEEGHT